MMTMAKNLSMLLVLASTGESSCNFKQYDMPGFYSGFFYDHCPSGSRPGAVREGRYCMKEYTVDNCWDFSDAPKCNSGDKELKKESCGWFGAQEKRTCADISVDWGCGCGKTARSCGCQCDKKCDSFPDVKEICEDDSFSSDRDHCMLHVETKGNSCTEYCEAQAMDNDGICGLNWGGHGRQSTKNNGCDQKWNDQICVCQNSGRKRRRSEVEEPKEVPEEPQQRTSLEELARAVADDVGGIDSQVLAMWKDSLRPESAAYLDILMLAMEAGESENEHQ